MKKTVCSLCLILLFVGFCFLKAQEKREAFPNYAKMRKYFGELYQQKKYREAAELMEWAIKEFPGHLEANSFNLAIVYGHLKEYEKATKVLKNALDQGIWFDSILFQQEIWAPFMDNKAFKEIMTGNEALKKEAQKNSKPDMFVQIPEGYSRDKKYPLFIALHGGGGNIQEFEENWRSKTLEKDFITAYLQSSQMVSMNGYSWTEDIELAKEEISNAFHQLIKEYPVDEDEVIIGGFSSGGVAALEVSFSQVIPVAGFVVLCPAKPTGFNNESVRNAKDRGLRGTLLTTEMDPRLSSQKEMAEVFKAEEFHYQFIVTPDIGHWFPEDIDVQIDRAIDHIRKKEIQREKDGFPVLKGPYLGQTPPGIIPQVFAPELSSGFKYTFCSVFTPDGAEYYFAAAKSDDDKDGIYWMRCMNNIWTKPEPAPFNSPEINHDMQFSADGSKIFFQSWRPLPGSNIPDKLGCLWFSIRKNNGWNEPQPVRCGGKILRAGYPDLSRNGTLYFSMRDKNTGNVDIHCSHLVSGTCTSPENLGSTINTEYIEGDLCVSPDERFIIVSCWERPDNTGGGESDLYISFRQSDGTWTKLINMGESVNTK